MSTEALPHKQNREEEIIAPPGVRTNYLATLPWWLVALALTAIAVTILLFVNDTYQSIFIRLREGVVMTLFISATAYAIATAIGLVVGLLRTEPPDAQSGPGKVIVYNLATLYLEVLRGLPILVVLLIIAFVFVPSIVDFLATTFGMDITIRDVPIEWRAIIALSLSYGAFLSEIFRAGIQSIDKGQIEASRSLGMTSWQTMRYIVLPQAINRVLPPLGNDLIAIIKDSSLVAILAVRDITQLAKLTAGQNFLYLETYLIAAFLYLCMTVVGSLAVRWIEVRFGEGSGAH